MTLVEIIVVVLLLSFLTLIFAPVIAQFFSSLSSDAPATLLAGHLQFCRSTAIKSNQIVILRLDLDKREYEAYTFDREQDKPRRRQLIEKVEIPIEEVRTAYSASISSGGIQVYFLPSGVAEELQFRFSSDGEAPQLLCYGRFTGETRLLRGDEAGAEHGCFELYQDAPHLSGGVQ
ncbi:MAG: GspH/FimT family protein [Leptospirales bacterium]|nr:GspH/FimT family protein [Leptospirales bacterium]